eukprot:TRINITY_DN30061_c0_g1_i1.p1 TRINITY_DN30061_c0_g1~~TRINITY_DN30061_c0_g1_i1.p1  ORF type:complete len:288 (+),score=96.59 TRINITY_DN30061_c0_g1_i1:64-927(+)
MERLHVLKTHLATHEGAPVVACAAGPGFDVQAVAAAVRAIVRGDPKMGPTLVRLAWHEAGTWDARRKDGGANTASMRFAPECQHAANAGLQRARDVLEPVKAAHPGISYADLWSLAGCVAIEAMRGPKIQWRYGRADATSAAGCAPDGRLPDASQGPDHIRDVFSRMGFTDRETVALVGAHTIGRCHADRSGYVGPWSPTPHIFNNTYFKKLVHEDWVVDKAAAKLQFKDATTGKLMMLPGDVALLFDKPYRVLVEEYARDKDAFFRDFAAAFQKLVELGTHDLRAL